MFISVNKLANELPKDKPDNLAANALQEGLSEIFIGSSPFGDGELEALDGLPEGFDIPQMPEAPQEYAPGLDKVLKDKAMSTI
jgi:Mn-containing catalase